MACGRGRLASSNPVLEGSISLVIPADLSARILRLYKAERWRVGTIARQLHVHRDTVRRVLAQAGDPAPASPLRPSRVDPYRVFILQTLERFPTLTAARLFAMVYERGYRGSAEHFRHVIAGMRPRPAAEAFLRLRTLPGEQAQVDWGHFGHLQIGRARRPLMAFVMVLSYSRRIFLRFCLDARMDSFLRGHVEAFVAFGGVARVLLYDNLKSAVLERVGDAVRFNPELLAFAAHHCYEPRPVAIARGNEKGRVERSIRYIREAFFAAREFADLDDLNAQARVWCEGQASDRRWPQDSQLSVRQAFEAERASLLALPEREFALGERLAVEVGKTPYVRFDLNDYTVPHTHVRRTLSVLADDRRVRVFDGIQEVASHVRSYDSGQQIEEPAHIQALVEHKRAAQRPSRHRSPEPCRAGGVGSARGGRRARPQPGHDHRDAAAAARALWRDGPASGRRRSAAAWRAASQRGAPGARTCARGARPAAADRVVLERRGVAARRAGALARTGLVRPDRAGRAANHPPPRGGRR
jgi:transposase